MILRSIRKPFDFNDLAWTIIEVLNQLDEGVHFNASGVCALSAEKTDEDDLLAAAIRLAEGRHFREAKEALIRHLKVRPDSFDGWLWYSRVIGSLAAIDLSLCNAARIRPKDRELAEEFAKLKAAKSCLGTDQVWRCPFCWSPLLATAAVCHYCNANPAIGNANSPDAPSVRRDILDHAVERYRVVLQRESSPQVHYYLGIAYFHLECWNEALGQLSKADQLEPDSSFFKDQLRLLRTHVADRLTICSERGRSDVNSHDPVAVSRPAPQKKKILVVDDSLISRKVVAMTLSGKGYEIIEARNGDEAISRLQEDAPDLALLDVVLPGIDGYQILAMIKRSDALKHIPVIMLTGKDSFRDVLKGKLSGCNAYLTKPFDPGKLLERVDKYLQ
ncbi:MAG: response regulator [Deltaproteobacteria bacterium]|nr:response regulator [Deltaproteobacteria bacterium]